MEDDLLIFLTFIEEEQSFFTTRQYTASTTDTDTPTDTAKIINISMIFSTDYFCNLLFVKFI